MFNQNVELADSSLQASVQSIPLKHNSNMAVQQTANSLEVFLQLLVDEWELLRFRLREKGGGMRKKLSNLSIANISKLRSLVLWALNKKCEMSRPLKFDLDTASILQEMEKGEGMNASPRHRDTLADIARVLTEDAEDDGIIRAYSLRFPAWKKLPKKVSPKQEEDGSGEDDNCWSVYQLFNKPMSMEDDFDRLSMPSTLATERDSNEISSLKAQLAALNRQVNSLLAVKGSPADDGLQYTVRVEKVSAPCSPPPALSDDDGVFLHDEVSSSLSSPLDREIAGRCAGVPAPMAVAPPPPPPPPPPPISSSLPHPPPLPSLSQSLSAPSAAPRKLTFIEEIEQKQKKREAKALSSPGSTTSSEGDEEYRRNRHGSEEGNGLRRPTANELRDVQLRRTSTARSPGGTPLQHRSRLPADHGSMLATALRNKFATIHNNEHEEEEAGGDESWLDEAEEASL